MSNIDEKIKEYEPILTEKQEENINLNMLISINKTIEQGNFSKIRIDIGKDNEILRKNKTESTRKVQQQRFENDKIYNEHGSIMTNYSALIKRYYDILNKVELERKKLVEDRISVLNEGSQEISNEINLIYKINSSTKKNKISSELSNALKQDLEILKNQYSAFEKHLNIIISSQSSQITKLEGDMASQAEEVYNIQRELSESASKIIELHFTVDKENAANLNLKLNKLILLGVNVSQYRIEAQKKLENVQNGWKTKLRLFEDKSSKEFRENSKQKWIFKIENLITKIDKLNLEMNEIDRQKDEFDIKITTDKNRDSLIQNLSVEQKKLAQKSKNTNEKIKKSNTDLKNILKILEYKKKFFDDQNEQINAQECEIDNVRGQIRD